MIILKYSPLLDIAVAQSRLSTVWKNTRMTWEQLVNRLSQTQRTPETLKQYLSYTKERQGEIKDVGGFVGGYLRDGKRKKGHAERRQVVGLDVDYGGLEVWENLKLIECAACMYTTHKHRADAPRLRIVVLLSRPVSSEEYEAVARIIASWLGIDAFDDTTFQPERLMYWPSTAKGAEFLFDYADGTPLDVDKMLAELPDWRDPTTWPVSSRVADRVRRCTTDKAEDPCQKEGIVGAFCRAYSMYDAIAQLLDETYVPCEAMGENRYSLVGGSTSGGLVVYDNKFAYSHHATDPAGGRLCNAFDLVRLHKFGDMDEGAKPGTAPTKLASFKAMADFASNLKPVKREIVQTRRAMADDYGELEEEARKVGRAEDWTTDLETEGRQGQIKNTIANVTIILNNDEKLEGCFGYNEFEQRETAVRRLPWDKKGLQYPRPLTDTDDAELRLYMERCYGITGKGQITDALAITVRRSSYHPVQDYLDSLSWDGVERLDTLFIDLFGAEDSGYTRAVTRKTFTAAVARIYSPGCKFDHVLVLVGEQGVGKSTALSKMGRGWFSDSLSTLKGKEALEAVQGSWIIELGELAGLRRAEVETVKQFISKKEDRFRVAYGKRLEYFPRRCVFFGTTNEEDFLRDATGNRRFWVVDCKGRTGCRRVWDYLTSDIVGQLWAEAKARYESGEALYLDGEGMEEKAREIQDKHLERDDRSGLIQEYLDRKLPKDWAGRDLFARRRWLEDRENVGEEERRSVCVMEIWAECLGKEPTDITRRDSLELGRTMKAFRDWTPAPGASRFPMYGVQKRYERTCNQSVTKAVTKV